MPKYKVTWWEKNWWEVIVEAESPEEAIEKQQEWDDAITDNMRESDDGYIDSGDPEAELMTEEEVTDED